MKIKGKVNWFNVEKRYGFILGEDEKDYFVHQSAIEGEDPLIKEEEVEFDPVKGDRGMQAHNVKKL